MHIALMAAMARDDEYWQPISKEDWEELAAALMHDFGDLHLRVELAQETETGGGR